MASNELTGYRSTVKYDEEEELLQHENTDVVPARKYKSLLYVLILTILILIGITIFAIVYIVDEQSSDDSSSDTPITAICETEACHKLAADILRSMNTSVNPCDNFYNYVCDGWREENNWDLIKVSQSSTLGSLNTKQKEVFLSVLADDDNSLLQYDAVQKAKVLYDSCYDSDIDQEDLQKEELLKTFIKIVNFSDFNVNNLLNISNEQWNVNKSTGFQNAMAWMLRRQWDDLFTLYAYDEGILWIEQSWRIWINYNEQQWRRLMNTTFIPQYQESFGLTLEQARYIADLVVDFTINIANITTADSTYSDEDQRGDYITNTTIGEIENLFGSSIILDYTQIMTDLFYCDSMDCINAVIYLEPGVDFFNDLIDLIEATPPIIVQYWLFTDVLSNFFNYGVDQSRSEDRRDFCFARTRNEFPYVYGFIINQKMYPPEKYELALDITKRVKDDGIIDLMLNVATESWLDEQSLNNSLRKANNMELYVGLPPDMTNITKINKYYDAINTLNNLSISNGFVKNYALSLEFDVTMNLRIFEGEEIELHQPWPTRFKSGSTGTWLTGVNAFYSPRSIAGEKGNWFCMPQTITQDPMFDLEFPMAVNFAAWGMVVGHEITHGFDSSGSRFNWFGDEIEMWSNQTRDLYNNTINCFIKQYWQIEVEPDIYCNGTRTNTENTADNGGMAAALNAYKKYKQDMNINIDDTLPLLPGLDFTEDQIWWISYARTWCNVHVQGYYNTTNGNYNGVHGPTVARVHGVAQNFPEFSQAFNCPLGSPMNPAEKCGLWHNP